MCNLYSLTKGQAAIVALVKAMRDRTGNLPPMPASSQTSWRPWCATDPDGERELTMMRWGMPSSEKAIFDAASARAKKLEGKGKPVEF